MIDYFTPQPLTSSHAFVPSRPPPPAHNPARDSDIPSYYGRSSQDITAPASALPHERLGFLPSTAAQEAEKKRRRLWIWVAVLLGLLGMIGLVTGVVMGVRGGHGESGGGGGGGEEARSSASTSQSTVSISLPHHTSSVPITISIRLPAQPDITDSLASVASTYSSLIGSTTYSTVLATQVTTMGTTFVTATVSAPASTAATFTPFQAPTVGR